MLVSTCLNSATILVILGTKRLLRTYHNLLILNLCLVDLLLVFSSMSFSLQAVFDGGKFLMSHPMICKYLNGFLTVTFCITAIWSLFSIGVDRLLLVVFAQRFPPKRNRTYAMIAVSWLCGLFVPSLEASGTINGFQFDNTTRSCAGLTENSAVRTAMAIRMGIGASALLILYATMTFYIWREGRHLRRHPLAKSKPAAKPITTCDEGGCTDIQLDTMDSSSSDGALSGTNLKTPSAASADSLSVDPPEISVGVEWTATNIAKRNPKYKVNHLRQNNRAHRRVAIMGAVLVSATMLCWTPFSLYHAGYLAFIKVKWFGVFSLWLAFCNTITDPLIYAFMNRRVRAEMRRIAGKARGRLFALCRR